MKTVKSLIVFAAVVEHKSMHAAATSLKLTPSAISQHISKLEEFYKVKLLERKANNLKPTPAGSLLVDSCLRLRATLSEAENILENIHHEIADTITLAIPADFTILPAFQEALRHIVTHYPKINLQILENQTTSAIWEKADIILYNNTPLVNQFEYQQHYLTDLNYVLCASPQYLNQIEHLHCPQDLSYLNWLIYNSENYILQKDKQNHILKPNHIWHCPNAQTAYQLTCAGVGISIQLFETVKSAIDKQHLQIILPQWSLPSVPVYIFARKSLISIVTVINILQQKFQNS